MIGPVALARRGAEGRDWYSRARLEIIRYALQRRLCPRLVADMLAIASPRVSVQRSVAVAVGALEGRPVAHFRRVVDALQRRLEGRAFPSGPKVVPFALALRGDPDAIVVDVWVARAYGCASDTPTASERRRIVRSVRTVARTLGWTPAETQAAIWHGIILEHGRRPAALVLPL